MLIFRTQCRKTVVTAYQLILNEDKLDKHEKGSQSLNCKPLFFGAPKEIRTPDPLVRSQVLYPAELWAHAVHYTRYCIFLKAKPTLIRWRWN